MSDEDEKRAEAKPEKRGDSADEPLFPTYEETIRTTVAPPAQENRGGTDK